jgi:glycosyltransferase involved in cell wall biosynthesis
VVFNRHYDVDAGTLKNLMIYAKANGKKVIYETDDLLTGVDPANPAFTEVSKNLQQVVTMVTNADVCTTTGEPLRQELLKFNRNVEILPNCMDKEDWTLRKGGNKKVRVGWAGGSSHAKDLLLIADVVKELKEEIDFEFVIFGLVPKEWKAYIKELRQRYKEQKEERAKEFAGDLAGYLQGITPAGWVKKMFELDEKLDFEFEHHPFVPLKEYNKKLSDLNLDIGICPLEDTRFDRCKSAIKFYEYAMVGTMTLASKVTPYKEEVNCTVKNRHDKWKNKLKLLIENEQVREFLAEEQREWVVKNREIQSNIHLWEDVYSNPNKPSLA